MKNNLKMILEDSERVNSSRVWKFYYNNSFLLGNKTVSELEADVKILSTKVCWYLAIAPLTHTECKRLGFETKDELYGAFIELLKDRGWHPQTLSYLKKVLAPFQGIEPEENLELVCKSVISGKAGNQNAKKTTSEQEGAILEIYKQTGKIKTTFKKCRETENLGSITLGQVRMVIKSFRRNQDRLTAVERTEVAKKRESHFHYGNDAWFMENYSMTESQFKKRYSS
jgi:hypothetical protein